MLKQAYVIEEKNVTEGLLSSAGDMEGEIWSFLDSVGSSL